MTRQNETIERLMPMSISASDTTGAATLQLHLARYEFAASKIASAKRVLDIACGVGYGSALIADNMPSATVVAVDIAPKAIDYARSNYSRPNLEYVCADALEFVSENQFDAIVSLETIEHLPDPRRFVGRTSSSLLEGGGLMVASVPVTPSMDANPHHLSDFSETSFRRLMKLSGLVEIDAFRQVQPYDPLAVIARKEPRMSDMRRNLLSYYAAHPAKALARIKSTLLDGFTNKYLTLAMKKA